MSTDFKPAPTFMLVELPPNGAQSDLAREHIIRTAQRSGGRAKRVDQHKLLVQLILRSTPAMRQLAAQVFNDPDNPRWREEYGT